MPTSQWKAFTEAQPDKEYLALLSYLPLKKFSAIPRFLKYTRAIERQLETAAGLIGYSVRAQLLSKTFWTLSAWEDAGALRAFVEQMPHSEVMVKLLPVMSQTRFLQWPVTGSALPLDWREAHARFSRL